MTMFRVGAINTPSSRELCVIRALSSGGMRLKTFTDLATGQWVSIEFKHGEAIEGQVTACKGAMADVAFDQPIDVAAVMAPDPEGPTPRMPRIDIACPATVREGAKLVRARIIDISQGGVRVEGDDGLPVRAPVVVSIAGLEPEPAVVTWSSGKLSGLTFNRLLSIGQLVEWLRKQRKNGSAA